MANVMEKASKSDTQNVFLCCAKIWLEPFDTSAHFSSKLCYTQRMFKPIVLRVHVHEVCCAELFD